MRQYDADCAVGLVDGAVGFDAQAVFRGASTVPQPGRAVVAGTRVNPAQSLAHVPARVITSYSIHYTKLYEFERHVPRLTRLVRQVANETGKRAELSVEGVITSYSIHYTKLYDVQEPDVEGAAVGEEIPRAAKGRLSGRWQQAEQEEKQNQNAQAVLHSRSPRGEP